MLKVGLTGNIACRQVHRRRSVRALGRHTHRRGRAGAGSAGARQSGLAAIAAQFGARRTRSDGALDRPALRRRVLADPTALAALNGSCIPRCRARRASALGRGGSRGDRIVMSDIPLLFEAADPSAFDASCWWMRRRRCAQGPAHRGAGSSAREADQLIAAQMPAAAKRAGATTSSTTTAISPELEQRPRGMAGAPRAALDLARDASAYPPRATPPSEHRVSKVPDDLVYTAEHEYIAPTGDPGSSRIGITDYAQGELGDVVFVTLPKPGEHW